MTVRLSREHAVNGDRPAVRPALGELLVGDGLITPVQLADALRAQEASETYLPLGQILLERRLVPRDALTAALLRHDKRWRLGQLLRRAGLVSDEQLAIALAQQRAERARLGALLLRLNFVTRDDLTRLLWAQLNIPFVALHDVEPDLQATALLNRHYARKHRVLPIARADGTVTVAIDDADTLEVLAELEQVTGVRVSPVAAAPGALERGLDRAYGGDGATVGAEPRLEVIEDEAPGGSAPGASLRGHGRQLRDTRADDIVRRLLFLAVSRRASDIHCEMLSDRLCLRFRIDGVLQELDVGIPRAVLTEHAREIVSRLKILAQLDIAERRRPQSGGFRARLARDHDPLTFNFRVSIVPAYYGESAVVRVLDPRLAPRSVHRIGFSERLLETWVELLSRPTGIILITGPTGSGKSTTLYASLNTIYRPALKIVTAEDPIEYVYEHFTQSEVNPRVGNTFASYLRSFLRHDPEVIMIGEIRDEETAEMAFRAAQTGHLLLSTLHTNDAVGAVTRLLDLKVDPNLITSSLLGVLSQRLVRAVCLKCAEAYRPNPQILVELFGAPPDGFAWRRGRGCPHCNFSGYKGRLPVGELWVPSETDLLLINKQAPVGQLVANARKSTISAAEDVRDKLREGRTTPEEVIRALPYPWLAQFRHHFAGQVA